MGSHLRLTASDGHQFDAYLSEPSSPSNSVVIVIQEIFGVNRHIRSVADDYASQGVVAIAPGLFDRVQPGIQLNYNAADASRGMQIATQIGLEKPLLDIAATISDAAKGNTRKVGVVGFCWGGTLAWLTATRQHPSAAVAYYGGQITKFASEKPNCPVMLHFGAKDKHISPTDIQKIQQTHPGIPIHIYEDAGHGFNCDQRPDYNANAAREARSRTLAFFRSYLAPAEDKK
jgi:carboxymethylenebutenolidase